MTEIVHRLLSQEEFDRFFESPMQNVTVSAPALLDIWGYVEAIDQTHLGDISVHDVSYVYRHPNGRWEHVLIDTCAENVHLVIVLDRDATAIVGHHLLNLNILYGLGN